MKIKYLIIQLGLFTLGSFLLNAIPKVKIEVRNGISKIVRDGTISAQDVGGNKEDFDALVGFTKQVSILRNAKDVDTVLGVFKNSRDLLRILYDLDSAKDRLLPYEIGKTFNLKISNILIALAQIKEFVNSEVGFTKTYESARIFAYLMTYCIKIMERDSPNVLQNQTSCTDGKSIRCILAAEDSNNMTIEKAAEKSGNFLLIYVLGLLYQANNLDDLRKLISNFFGTFEGMKNDEGKWQTELENELVSITTLTGLNNFIKNRAKLKISKFQSEFDRAVINFSKRAKLKQ